MANGQIKISIGAVTDRSVDVVFGNIEKRANKLRENLLKALGGSSPTRGTNQLAKDTEKGFVAAEKTAIKSAQKIQSEQEKAAKAAVKAHDRAQKEIQRAFAATTAAAEREAAKQTRDAEREAKKQSRILEREASRQVGIREKFAERTSHRATRFFFPPPSGIIGAAGRIAGDVMRGAGVDLSISGGVSRAVSLQTGGIGLANQERIATGATQGSGFYAGLARKTGADRSVDPEQVMNMIRGFTGKTGDFGAAAKMADPLTSIGTASGASLDEMGDAAGFVYNQLNKLPDAANRTIAVMRGIVGQTAVGAVEMKDYATQMGRIAANANKFEGSVDTNIMKMSALAQLSIESGGATSAADAARAVGSFANTFGKNARIKAFKGAGVDLFTDKSQTTLRDPFEIVRDSFRKTKGNIPQLADMFADTLGRKPITSLGMAYKNAGGGEAGIAAITAALNKYMSAQLTPETERKNNEDYANSDAAKAQRFQNNLDKVVASAADKVFPALEKLAPQALAVADAFGKVVGYVADNPIKSVILALVAAIGRAGLESVLRAAIEKQIMGVGGGLLPGRGIGPDGAPLPTGGGVWSTGAGRMIKALGMGAIGYSLGDTIGRAIGGEGGAQSGSSIGGGAAFGASLGGPMGALAGATLGAVVDQAQDLGKATEGWGGTWEGTKSLFSGDGFFKGVDEYQNKQAKHRRMVEDQAAAGGAPANQQPLDSAALSRGVADGMAARTLQVKVVNAKDFATSENKGPRVDPAGRSSR